MLRLSETDPLALALFAPKDLKGLRKQQRRTKGKRAGQITDVQSLANELERRGYPEHEREFRFAQHLGRQWRFDFAWPQIRVALEFDGIVARKLDGHMVMYGRHATFDGHREDIVKLNTAACEGWLVLRCEQKLLAKGEIYGHLERVLRQRGAIWTAVP